MSIFDELADNLEEILAMYHMGVITSLAKALVRLKTKQKKFLQVNALTGFIWILENSGNLEVEFPGSGKDMDISQEEL